MKRTVVIGASPNPRRYSYLAAQKLMQYGHETVLLGNKEGTIENQPIITTRPELNDIDTVTMYLNSHNQRDWYSYLLGLHPRRIIFNPGAENAELASLAQEHNINTEEACTLVLLSSGQY